MSDPKQIVSSIREKLNAQAASGTAPTPQSIAVLLEALIQMEPQVVELLPLMFPGNPVVTAAVSLLPTLLPALQTLEAALAAA